MTNGILVTPEIARTVARRAVTVQISIDGPKERHDRHRKHRDGSGSYEAVLRGVEALRSANPDAKIDGQAILTPGNVDMVAIAGHLRSLGFRRLSFLVAGWEDRTGIAWTDKDLEALDRVREAFFPFFLESARRGDPEVDTGFARAALAYRILEARRG